MTNAIINNRSCLLEVTMNSRELLRKLESSFEAEDEYVKKRWIEYQIDVFNELWLDGEVEKDEKFLKEIEALPAIMLFKLLKQVDTFEDYCERHPELWHDYLVRCGYHGETLPSLDRREEEEKNEKEKCTNLKQYIGEFLLQKWDESHDPEILDKACEMNTMPALVARCHLNLEQLEKKMQAGSSTEIKTLEDKIIGDIEHINNQYWAAGYVYSYTAFFKLATLHHVNSSTPEEPAIEEQVYFRGALECELMATKLAPHTISQQVLKEHGGVKKWLENSKLKIDTAEEDVLKALHIDRNSSIYTEAREKVEKEYTRMKI
jgi:hypothetical protein